jgi:predicted transcriptional regulator
LDMAALTPHRRRLRTWTGNHHSRDERVIAAREAGMTVMEIHKETGLSRTTIYKILEGSKKNAKPMIDPNEDHHSRDERVIAAREAGMTMMEIHRETGLSRTTIYKILEGSKKNARAND